MSEMPNSADSFEELLNYAKLFSGLTREDTDCLKDIAPIMMPHLAEVTEQFYQQLNKIPDAANFIKDRVDALKPIHLRWLNSLFTQDINEDFDRVMYRTGDTHAKEKVPGEFMSGAMTLLRGMLINLVFTQIGESKEQQKAVRAINAITGFSLTLMLCSFFVHSTNPDH